MGMGSAVPGVRVRVTIETVRRRSLMMKFVHGRFTA